MRVAATSAFAAPTWAVRRRPRVHAAWHASAATAVNDDRAVDRRLAERVVVVTGATGLVGRALVARLRAADVRLFVLARSPSRVRAVFPGRGAVPLSVVRYDAADAGAVSEDVARAVAQADVVVNLAGEPVDAGRWTPERKKVLWDSRVVGTKKIAEAMGAAGSKAVLINASAVGFYGTSKSRECTEETGPGSDFLARLAVAWEAAALAKTPPNVRAVVLRFGVVLGNGGGALEKMSAAFRAFLGGPPGGGDQWFSWVHIDDVVRLILHAIVEDEWHGVYNCNAPQPIRLSQFCSELGRALGRPSWLPVPRKAVQALLGSEAAELILAGQQVRPERTLAAGFTFRYSNVASALEELTISSKVQR